MEERDALAARKAAMRKEARLALRGLAPDAARLADAAIARAALALTAYQQAAVVFCFVGTENEVDTRPILRHALESGKVVAVPRCTGPGVMEARRIEGLAALRPGAYGILEPDEGCPIVASAAIGFALVPCLACDRAGGRLGHGGGYYDRFLAEADCATAAVCREAQLVSRVPREPWDRPVDFVVTEENVYTSTSSRKQLKHGSALNQTVPLPASS